MRVKFLVLGLICLLIFASMACLSTKVVYSDDRISRPMVYWRAVKIYQSADQVESDYEEIALLITAIWFTGELSSTEGSWYISGLKKKARNSMKKKAAKMGANAIILDAMSEPSTGVKVMGDVLGVGTDRKGKVVAIYIYPERK